MKKNSVVLFIVLSIFAASCEQIENLLTFEIEDTIEFTIPSSTVINSPISIPTPPIQSSSTQTFENNNTNASLVKNVSLKDLNLKILKPETKTFRFIQSIEIYISAEDVEEVLLASKYNIPENVGNTLILDTSGEKLDNYIKKGQYDIRTVVQVKEIPGQDVTVDAKMVFKVTADPL